MAGYDSFRSIGPVMTNVNATGLRTALRRRDLGAELPYLAVLRLSESDPKQTYTTDRYQRGAYTDPHKNPRTWSRAHNSLHHRR
jgi:hypothetical protein